MTNAADMLKHIPFYERTSRVILALQAAIGSELDLIDAAIADVLLQYYVDTATDEGLVFWESFVGISSYVGQTLAERRSRIISKIRGIGTVTVAMIKDVAESFEYGLVNVTEDNANYAFEIKFTDVCGVPSRIADVQAAIEDIKPAHLAVTYAYTYTVYNVIATSGLTYDQIRTAGITYEQVKTWTPA